MTADLSIERETLQDWLATGRPVILVDVRPAAEHAEWFIPGSLHVDAYDRLKAGDPDTLDAVDLPAGTPVVTICAAGRTSLIAAEQLRVHALEALSLTGGRRAWSLAWNTATLAEVRQATALLAADEDTFVTTILGRIPATPPNHAQIIALNEGGAALPADPTELEAGANRCAIA